MSTNGAAKEGMEAAMDAGGAMAQYNDVDSRGAVEAHLDQREGEDGQSSLAAKRAVRASLVDAPSLGAALCEISREIAGQSSELLPAMLIARLARTAPFRAAGLWLARPDGRSFHRRALFSAPGLLSDALVEPDEASSVPRAVFEPVLADARLRSYPLTWPGSALSVARELLPPEVPTSLLRSMSFTGVPLPPTGRPAGIVALFSARPLDGDELTALQLFGFHIAAELARAAAPAAADRSPESRVDFIALLTHELRSPLTGLRGNVQLASMAARKGNYGRLEGRLDTAMRLVDSVNALVTNLQDINHLERGIFTVSPAPGDLTATLRVAVQRVERSLSVDHLTFELVAPESIVCAYDARRMEQTLFNLLTNAVVYSPDGGTIEVRAERDRETAVVTIRDQGIGIPLEDQERIFEPYSRGTNGRAVNAGGLGLGLAISRETVLRHGGTIEVRSLPGEGSRFVVRLPLSPPATLA